MLFFLMSSALAADPRHIPDELWAEVLEALDLPEDRVGYSAAEMAPYGGQAAILPGVVELFRDPRDSVRTLGKLSDDLVLAQTRPDEQLRLLYKLLGASAGRRVPLPGLDEDGGSGEIPPAVPGASAGQPPIWGLAGLEDGLPPSEAMARLWTGKRSKARTTTLERFASLPEPVQRLAVRLAVASHQVGPWVQAAFATSPARGLPTDEAYTLLSAIRAETDWAGSMATLERRSFEALESTDLGYLAFASVTWTKALRLALEEFDAAGGPALLSDPACAGFGELVLPTALGPLVVTDAEGRSHARGEAPMLLLDLGGDDSYIGRFAVSTPWPVAALVDLGGDDQYAPGDLNAASLATGLLGIGALVDRSGDDLYQARESSLAASWHGTGILIDESGNDRYALAGSWGSAAAHIGVALLVDQAGDDSHVAKGSAQGMGGPLGAALLLDHVGDDRYTIPDDADPSALYLGRTVAMSQGCGYGRRADLGDGHSLAGGYGMLIDLAGDDHYHAMAWSQGAAYWWGVGLLDDRSGDDRYRNGKYSLGAGAHFGVGLQVDHAGDDRYNAEAERFVNPHTGVEAFVAENQFQGHGRDGSLGLSLELGGDDHYLLRSHSGGSGDLGSIGLFYEAGGNDLYRFLPPEGEAAADGAGVPALGSTTHYPTPFQSWRDDLFTVGVFLDAAGVDVYEQAPPERGDGQRWSTRRSAQERSVGIDRANP